MHRVYLYIFIHNACKTSPGAGGARSEAHRVEPCSSRTLPRVPPARRCRIPWTPWWPWQLFPLPRRTWTFSWIFHDGALQPRFSPRSSPADRRTPASSQWHEPTTGQRNREELPSNVSPLRDLYNVRKPKPFAASTYILFFVRSRENDMTALRRNGVHGFDKKHRRIASFGEPEFFFLNLETL